MKKLLLVVPFLAVMLLQSLPAWSHGYGWYARRGMANNGGYGRGYGGYGGGYGRGYGGGYGRGYSGYGGGYGGMNPYQNYGNYGGGYGGYGGGMGGGLSRLFRGY